MATNVRVANTPKGSVQNNNKGNGSSITSSSSGRKRDREAISHANKKAKPSIGFHGSQQKSDAITEEFQLLDVTLKCALAPVHIPHPMEEVENQLNGLLFKYSDEVGGVPLCFTELQLVKGKEYGRIMAEQPWLHVSVCTKLLIFKPIVGRVLNAKVTQVSDNHVSMLTYGMFNASVSGAEMCKKYVYKNSSKAWESIQGDISEGDSVQFRIGSFQQANGVLNIDALDIKKK